MLLGVFRLSLSLLEARSANLRCRLEGQPKVAYVAEILLAVDTTTVSIAKEGSCCSVLKAAGFLSSRSCTMNKK